MLEELAAAAREEGDLDIPLTMTKSTGDLPRVSRGNSKRAATITTAERTLGGSHEAFDLEGVRRELSGPAVGTQILGQAGKYLQDRLRNPWRREFHATGREPPLPNSYRHSEGPYYRRVWQRAPMEVDRRLPTLPPLTPVFAAFQPDQSVDLFSVLTKSDVVLHFRAEAQSTRPVLYYREHGHTELKFLTTTTLNRLLLHKSQDAGKYRNLQAQLESKDLDDFTKMLKAYTDALNEHHIIVQGVVVCAPITTLPIYGYNVTAAQQVLEERLLTQGSELPRNLVLRVLHPAAAAELELVSAAGYRFNGAMAIDNHGARLADRSQGAMSFPVFRAETLQRWMGDDVWGLDIDWELEHLAKQFKLPKLATMPSWDPEADCDGMAAMKRGDLLSQGAPSAGWEDVKHMVMREFPKAFDQQHPRGWDPNVLCDGETAQWRLEQDQKSVSEVEARREVMQVCRREFIRARLRPLRLQSAWLAMGHFCDGAAAANMGFCAQPTEEYESCARLRVLCASGATGEKRESCEEFEHRCDALHASEVSHRLKKWLDTKRSALEFRSEAQRKSKKISKAALNELFDVLVTKAAVDQWLSSDAIIVFMNGMGGPRHERTADSQEHWYLGDTKAVGIGAGAALLAMEAVQQRQGSFWTVRNTLGLIVGVSLGLAALCCPWCCCTEYVLGRSRSAADESKSLHPATGGHALETVPEERASDLMRFQSSGASREAAATSSRDMGATASPVATVAGSEAAAFDGAATAVSFTMSGCPP